jgi:hypothetical protein
MLKILGLALRYSFCYMLNSTVLCFGPRCLGPQLCTPFGKNWCRIQVFILQGRCMRLWQHRRDFIVEKTNNWCRFLTRRIMW